MIWPFLRKKAKIGGSSPQSASTPKMECNNDPDCPMCHVSDDIVKQLQDNEEGDEQTSEEKE